MTSKFACQLIAAVIIAFGTSSLGHAVEYDIYIAAGQSNMDGRGFRSDLTGELAEWNAQQPNAIIHYTSPQLFQQTWSTLEPGFASNGAPPHSGRFGPELSFARTMTEATGKPVAILKVSRGGTNLGNDWNPSTGYMYAALESTLTSALGELTARGDSGSIKGMIWHQGESDDILSLKPHYETNLTNFINSVRNDLLGDPDMPFVIGELLQEWYPGQYEELRTAQWNVAQALDHVGFANSVGLQTTDGLHFLSPGVIEIGERFASEMLALSVPEPHTFLLSGIGMLCLGMTRRRY